MRRERWADTILAGLVVAALLAACTANGEAEVAGDGEPHEAREPQEAASQEVVMPILDLDTLQAELPGGTAQAEPATRSWTGSLGDGRAIGVAELDEVADDGSTPIVVYVYEGQRLAVLTGPVDADGSATLDAGDHNDFDATVEIAIDGDTASGAVTFPEEEPHAFTASAASADGVSGVYWARGVEGNPEIDCDWLVLADGTQWGCVCLPPYVSACCMLRF